MFNPDKNIHTLIEGSGMVIADIGGAGGIQDRWQPFSGTVQFSLFEPDARERPEGTGDNVRVVPKALAATEGEIKLNLCRKPQVSSIYAPNRGFIDRFPDADRYDVLSQQALPATTLDGWCGEENLQPDFMKIDTEGSELEILKGGSATLNHVLGMEIEIAFQPLRNGQPLCEDIISHLREHEFDLHDFLRLYRWGREKHGQFGQVTFADALFLRPPEQMVTRIAETAPEQQGDLAARYLFICAAYRLTDIYKVALAQLGDYLDPQKKQAAETVLKTMLRCECMLNTMLKFAWRLMARLDQMPMPFWNR